MLHPILLYLFPKAPYLFASLSLSLGCKLPEDKTLDWFLCALHSLTGLHHSQAFCFLMNAILYSNSNPLLWFYDPFSLFPLLQGNVLLRIISVSTFFLVLSITLDRLKHDWPLHGLEICFSSSLLPKTIMSFDHQGLTSNQLKLEWRRQSLGWMGVGYNWGWSWSRKSGQARSIWKHQCGQWPRGWLAKGWPSSPEQSFSFELAEQGSSSPPSPRDTLWQEKPGAPGSAREPDFVDLVPLQGFCSCLGR